MTPAKCLLEAQSGEHNDLYELETLFKEMIEVLEQAAINCKGIFLNADPGFDSEDFREVCRQNDIELNVKQNKRNKKQADCVTTSILMGSYINAEQKLNMPMHGWTPSKRYLSDTKSWLSPGWLCSGSLLLRYFVEK